MDPTIISTIITASASVMVSSGLMTYLFTKCIKKDNRTSMLLGLGHDRILYLGMQYLQRGYITKDEYENLYDYLYLPYEKMGGNGSAKRVMEEVNKLPLYKSVLNYASEPPANKKVEKVYRKEEECNDKNI